MKETESKSDLRIRTERGDKPHWEFTRLNFGKLPETIGKEPTGATNSDFAKGCNTFDKILTVSFCRILRTQGDLKCASYRRERGRKVSAYRVESVHLN